VRAGMSYWRVGVFRGCQAVWKTSSVGSDRARNRREFVASSTPTVAKVPRALPEAAVFPLN
jgi:hypothetical protein